MTIIWSFINKFESHPDKDKNLEGFVPNCTKKSVLNINNKYCFGKPIGTPIENSGVTVGAGIDLGQNGHLYNKLKAETYNVIRPYIGLRKQDAINLINSIPLLLKPEQLEEIETLIKDTKLMEFIYWFNMNNKNNVEFNNLPNEIQTAIFSFGWQNGLKTKAISWKNEYWDKVLNNDWVDVKNILMFKSLDYKKRRNDEAELIQLGINKMPCYFHYTLEKYLSRIIASGIYPNHPYFTNVEYFNAYIAGQELGVMENNIDCVLKFIDDGNFKRYENVPGTNRFIGGGLQFGHSGRPKPIACRLITERIWKNIVIQ